MAVVFAFDVNALVMGDVQVASRLGQVLNAEIAITDFSVGEILILEHQIGDLWIDPFE